VEVALSTKVREIREGVGPECISSKFTVSTSYFEFIFMRIRLAAQIINKAKQAGPWSSVREIAPKMVCLRLEHSIV